MITPVRPMPETGRTPRDLGRDDTRSTAPRKPGSPAGIAARGARPPAPTRRCYIEHGDGSACTLEARYQAHLTWTAGLMLLCEDHAADERAHGDVIDIRTIH